MSTGSARAQRRLLAASSVLVPVATVLSVPMAFGLELTTPDDDVNRTNPLSAVLWSLVVTAVVMVIGAWCLALTVARSGSAKARGGAIACAAVATVAGGAIVGTFVAALSGLLG